MTTAGSLWLTDARVIDGLGGDIERATIEIVDGRIAAIHMGAAPVAPPDDRIVDLAGRTVLPGLIDVHVHLSSYDHL